MTNNPSKTFTFQAEIQELLSILANSLYIHKEVFLRELISNAHDALNRIRFELLTNRNVLDPDSELVIKINFDEDKKTLTVSDTGIGMNENELIANIGTIASSGSRQFLNSARKNGKVDLELIGTFGVGFYSVFMVASEVKIRSRSFQLDTEGVEWVSEGKSGEYTISSYDKSTRGTEIILTLQEDANEFLNEYRIKNIVKKYSDFVPFPIKLKDEIINQQIPLWRKSKKEVTEEDFKKFYNQILFQYDEPLYKIHYSAEGAVQFRSLLFIPEKQSPSLFHPETDWGLKLYSHSVLIQDHSKDVLPQYFRFVKGVIESSDLPLNISRETVQSTRVLATIKKNITGKILRELDKIASKDKEKYEKFYREYGIFVKEGIATDVENKKTLTKLLRFYSTKTEEEELTSLESYVSRMKENQDKIYYLIADGIEIARNSPHLDYYHANDLEVLLFVDPIDSYLPMHLTDFADNQFVAIDQIIEEEKDKEEKREEVEEIKEKPSKLPNLMERTKQILKDKIIDVKTSSHLIESPCRLVGPADGIASSMERIFRYMDEDREIPKKILEYNENHSIIKNLEELISKDATNKVIDLIIEQLFENALLQEGFLPKPGKMIPRIQNILELAVQRSLNVE
ncbi:MAG: molecular chaperone HtpG [Promethearchaeota archaeon]